MILSKKHSVLIGLIVVFLVGGTFVYFGWTKLGSEPASPSSEQTKPESVRQVIIPFSLDPKDVVENIVVPPYYFEWKSKEGDPSLKEFWERYLGISSSGKELIGYAGAMWLKNYLKRDGAKVHEISEEVPLILFLHVLKYEKPEFAQEDYNKINIDRGFKISTSERVKLKIKVGMPPTMEEELSQYIKLEQFQQYVIQSNNFIIYAVGLKEAAEDVMIRLIDRYGVE